MSADTDLLLDTVAQFATKAEQRLFAVEAPDGDLDAVDDLLLDAAGMGLLGEPDGEAGRWAVWGGHVDEAGTGLSLGMLRRLGRVCAGVATAVHAQGLGVLLLGPRAAVPADARIGAGFCPPVGIALDPRTLADTMAVKDGRLDGVARFVLCAGAPDVIVLAAREGDEWVLVALPAGTQRLRIDDAGRRIGLRATTMVDVHADTVEIESRLATGAAAEDRLRRTIACDWLGQAAIALGTAERAVREANAYAATRVQAGVPIAEHAAVRLLLARAEHDVAVVAAVLERHADVPLTRLSSTALLRWAVDARLAAGEHATRGVTDSLQTLGGYGYMDDYGLSKRLRDVTALRVLHGGPDQLLLARHELEAAL